MDEKWVELANMLKEPLNQLIVLSVMLGFYVFSHSILVASGARRVKKQNIKWSWDRFWSDVKDRLLAIYVLCGLVVAIDMIQWLSPLVINAMPDQTIMAVLNVGVIIALPFVAGVAEIYQAARNAIKLWGWAKNIKLLGIDPTGINANNDNYQEIVNDVSKFVETITKKTVREQLIEDGVDLDKVESSEEPVGKGSGNTYPEPYRSRPKDSLVDPSTCYNRECVSYTAWKLCEQNGSWPVRTGGMNAKLWVDRLPSWGYKMVSAPKKGGKYIGVLTSGTYGHVVWFEKPVNNSTVQISEYNYADAGNYGIRNVPILGYIWFEIQAPNNSKPTISENTGANGFKVGDKVLPKEYVDYDGRKLRKTKDYYVITSIQGDRAVLSWENSIYAAVNTKNLVLVDKATTVPTTPSKPSNKIEVNDIVVPTKLVDYYGTPLVSYDPNYVVINISGDRAVLSARGQVWAAMNVVNLKKV